MGVLGMHYPPLGGIDYMARPSEPGCPKVSHCHRLKSYAQQLQLLACHFTAVHTTLGLEVNSILNVVR